MNPKASSTSILIVMAVSAFSIGTAEFVMAGVLPDIAQSLLVSIPQAGLLMTGYALSVLISAPILTAFAIGYPRKIVLIGLMGFFVVGNLISALAPSYHVLMTGRVISALCHGAFFGIGAVAVADAVTPDKKAKAIALMFSGLTVANVLGVPIGTMLGQTFGWRSMFYVIAASGMTSMSGIMLLFPYQKITEKPKLKSELLTFKIPQVWLSLFITAFGFGGLFASFAYITPLMTQVTGFTESNMPWILFLFGIGLVIGNIIGGKFGDNSLDKSLYVLFISLAVSLIGLVFTSHNQVLSVLTLFLIGVLGFAIVSPVQTQVMKYAKSAPTIASAANISAFNIGIAAGTYFGGLSIHFGFGYTSASWVGGMMVTVGLILQLITVNLKNPLSF